MKVYNKDIWPEPFEVEIEKKHGLDGVFIPLSEIPFNSSELEEGDFIENEETEVLQYVGKDGYVLVSNFAGSYLSGVFSKWKKR